MKNSINATEFWDNVYFKNEINTSMDQIIEETDFVTEFLDKVKGKEVLDLGCGRGYLSLILAHYGARVTSIDISENACNATKHLLECNKNQFSYNMAEVICMDAMDLEKLGENRFDYVFGKFILHHIEPFDKFAEKLAYVTKPGGLQCFYENSANNPILMICRKLLVGRFGIPRYGDGIESPLCREEVNELNRYFRIQIEIPKLVLFQMLNTYIFRQKASFLIKWDEWCFRKIPSMRKWSYHQIITAYKDLDKYTEIKI